MSLVAFARSYGRVPVSWFCAQPKSALALAPPIFRALPESGSPEPEECLDEDLMEAILRSIAARHEEWTACCLFLHSTLVSLT